MNHFRYPFVAVLVATAFTQASPNNSFEVQAVPAPPVFDCNAKEPPSLDVKSTLGESLNSDRKEKVQVTTFLVSKFGENERRLNHVYYVPGYLWHFLPNRLKKKSLESLSAGWNRHLGSIQAALEHSVDKLTPEDHDILARTRLALDFAGQVVGIVALLPEHGILFDLRLRRVARPELSPLSLKASFVLKALDEFFKNPKHLSIKIINIPLDFFPGSQRVTAEDLTVLLVRKRFVRMVSYFNDLLRSYHPTKSLEELENLSLTVQVPKSVEKVSRQVASVSGDEEDAEKVNGLEGFFNWTMLQDDRAVIAKGFGLGSIQSGQQWLIGTSKMITVRFQKDHRIETLPGKRVRPVWPTSLLIDKVHARWPGLTKGQVQTAIFEAKAEMRLDYVAVSRQKNTHFYDSAKLPTFLRILKPKLRAREKLNEAALNAKERRKRKEKWENLAEKLRKEFKEAKAKRDYYKARVTHLGPSDRRYKKLHQLITTWTVTAKNKMRLLSENRHAIDQLIVHQPPKKKGKKNRKDSLAKSA